MEPVQPQVKEYDNYSGGIVDASKDLEATNEEQPSPTQKSEMQGQHSSGRTKMGQQKSIRILNKKEAKTKSKRCEGAGGGRPERARRDREGQGGGRGSPEGADHRLQDRLPEPGDVAG